MKIKTKLKLNLLLLFAGFFLWSMNLSLAFGETEEEILKICREMIRIGNLEDDNTKILGAFSLAKRHNILNDSVKDILVQDTMSVNPSKKMKVLEKTLNYCSMPNAIEGQKELDKLIKSWTDTLEKRRQEIGDTSTSLKEGSVIYHGTSLESARKIVKSNLIDPKKAGDPRGAGNDKRSGKNIDGKSINDDRLRSWFTDSPEAAQGYAGKDGVILVHTVGDEAPVYSRSLKHSHGMNDAYSAAIEIKGWKVHLIKHFDGNFRSPTDHDLKTLGLEEEKQK